MVSHTGPLITERAVRSDGLVVARQAPPAAAASFSATYVAPAGWAYDPESAEGLALITSQLLTSGAGRRGRIAFARELDRRGATLQTHCHPESQEVTLWGPMAAFEPLMDLLADVVLSPGFDDDDLARVCRQTLERQLRESSQPDSRAERELYRELFPRGHPYRLTGVGTPRSIGAIRRSDVQRFHRRHFTAEGAFVAVTAPRSLRATRAAVDRRFHSFDRAKAPAAPPVPPPTPHPPTLRRVAMPGRSQVEVRVGGPSVPRSSEWYPAAFLANELLGGRPLLARLFQRVRERHGLAYHASSELEAMRWGGYWAVQAGTGPERVRRVVPMLLDELERLHTEPVRSAELDAVRRSVIGELPLSMETTSSAHALLVDVTYHNLPEDFYRTWPATLRALTPSQIRRGAEEGLGGKPRCTIVAGPISRPARPARTRRARASGRRSGRSPVAQYA